MRTLAPRSSAVRGSRAFLIEALVLMTVLTACLAVMVHGFSVASSVEARAALATRAASAATAAAERFCDDPSAIPAVVEDEGLVVRVDKTQERTGAGILWHAVFEVAAPDGEAGTLATLETSAYEPTGGE